MDVYDRDELLGRVELAELATELCGAPEGRTPSARWRCPNPDHPDTHPSMTVYRGPRSQRWKCHACGEGGTAIDLVMVARHIGVRDALDLLAARAQLAPIAAADRRDATGPPWRAARRDPTAGAARGPTPRDSRGVPLPPAAVDPGVERYVAAAEAALWDQRGDRGREWLFARGLSEEVLRANRVGFDPGPRLLARGRGLPWRGTGVVYPVLAADRTAVYCQTRHLDPAAAGGRKYANPTAELAVNPRVAVVRAPGSDPRSPVVVVAEGIPDGLAAAHLGVRVAAVIGAANHGPFVAHGLHQLFPRGDFLVVFDADHAGRRGGELLAARLSALHRRVVLTTPPGAHPDLNDWWCSEPRAVQDAVATAAAPLVAGAPHSLHAGPDVAPGTVRALETDAGIGR